MLSTPIAAVALVDLFSPDLPPVMSKADARGATAIVVLGAGMDVHRSRGGSLRRADARGSLRVLEAARLHRVLGGVPIIATGGHGLVAVFGSRADGASARAARACRRPHHQRREVDATRAIMRCSCRRCLKQHGIEQFVLVTSQQHIARALAAFRAVGLDPVPSTPEVYVARGGVLEMYLPSRVGLDVSDVA